MKKHVLLMVACATCMAVSSVCAQITESEDGNVGIKVGNATPLSTLSVATPGDSQVTVDISSTNVYALRSYTSSATSWSYGLYGRALPCNDKHIGVYGSSSLSSPSSHYRAYGVLGTAGNATSGWNYGVFGALGGTNNGAAVLGTVESSTSMSWAVPGRYAGYFVGPVHSTGEMTASAFTVTSDARLKREVRELSSSLGLLSQLVPVEYKLQQSFPVEYSDTMQTARAMSPASAEKESLRYRYGLIAQDVAELFPDIVYEDGNGYLSIDYIGLIPLLIQSVKELNEEVETLKAYKDALANAGAENVETENVAVLYQNTPNPFTSNTEIRFGLPDAVQSAAIYIYNMVGEQIESYDLTNNPDNKIVVESGHLTAGMYLYALVVNGKLIDTKQMILTE